MNKIPLIVFLIIFQNVTGQSIKPENSDDLYAQTLNYYLDSIINRDNIYNKIFETLPKEQRFTDFLLVGDNEIISKIPDETQFVHWTKMNKNEFCDIRKPNKKWDWILFIKSDNSTDSIMRVSIMKYYSQYDDCDIEFQNSEEYFYHRDNINNGYIIDSIARETYVIIYL